MKKYRVRRGWFGRSILQGIVDTPSLVGGVVDGRVRDIRWEDVPYDRAPSSLGSHSEYIDVVHKLEIEIASLENDRK